MDSKKAKGIAADFVTTGTEAVVETAADNLPLLASAIHDAGFQGAASILADGVVGAVAPGALGLVFGYRMRRTERNLIILIDKLSSNIEIVNERLDSLEATDCYAIENYICTCKCFVGICSTACGNAESALAAIDKQEVERIYSDAFDKFEHAISNIPEMSIAWRRYGLKPNMRNINLKQLLTIENGNVNVKCAEVLATIKRQVGISCESPTISDSEIEDIGHSLEAYGDFVARTNGKLIFDFFQMLLGSMQHYEFPSGAKITRNQLLTSNVLSTGIAIQGCPNSLRSFLMALRK